MDSDAASAFFRAERLRHEGSHRAAADAYRDLLDIHPRHAAAWRGLAAALDALVRPGEAAEARRAGDAVEADGMADIGASLLFGGDPTRARICLERALAGDPGCLKAHWLLGELHARAGARGEALAHYRRCREIAPDRVGPAYMMAALGEGPVPGRAPEDYVVAFFDWYADGFDEHLTATLAYTGPRVVADALTAAVPGPLGRVVDLGCGTGLAGAELAGRTRHLAGIDLSPAMLERARGRSVYDELVEGDLCAALDARPAGAADAAVAADVFVYLGDLGDVFAAVARALAPGGVLVATFEASEDREDDGWTLSATGRYSHGAGYLRAAAAGAGLEAERIDDAAIRIELGLPVASLVAVFRKPGGTATPHRADAGKA